MDISSIDSISTTGSATTTTTTTITTTVQCTAKEIISISSSIFSFPSLFPHRLSPSSSFLLPANGTTLSFFFSPAFLLYHLIDG